jgi:hypothetical protein
LETSSEYISADNANQATHGKTHNIETDTEADHYQTTNTKTHNHGN